VAATCRCGPAWFVLSFLAVALHLRFFSTRRRSGRSGFVLPSYRQPIPDCGRICFETCASWSSPVTTTLDARECEAGCPLRTPFLCPLPCCPAVVDSTMSDLQLFLIFLVLWQAGHMLSAAILRRVLATPTARRLVPSPECRATLAADGPSYVISSVHALVVTARGIGHIRALALAPPLLQLHLPSTKTLPAVLAASGVAGPVAAPPSPDVATWLTAARSAVTTNCMLGAYLAFDLVHVVATYPRLGKADTVAHHVAFLFCSAAAGALHLFPFMFGWLVIGEASTPMLNVRWALIKAGRGDGQGVVWASTVFAITFFTTRFVIYGAGLFGLLRTVRQVVPWLGGWSRGGVFVVAIVAFVVAGWGLNMVWLRQIWQLARRGGRRKGSKDKGAADKAGADATEERIGRQAEGGAKRRPVVVKGGRSAVAAAVAAIDAQETVVAGRQGKRA